MIATLIYRFLTKNQEEFYQTRSTKTKFVKKYHDFVKKSLILSKKSIQVNQQRTKIFNYSLLTFNYSFKPMLKKQSLDEIQRALISFFKKNTQNENITLREIASEI